MNRKSVRMRYRKIDRNDIHMKINIGLRSLIGINLLLILLSGANSSYAHYSQANFTVREVARLQTFDDGFIFYGSIRSQYKQVGNAVPPKIAEKIAEQVKQLLDSISL